MIPDQPQSGDSWKVGARASSRCPITAEEAPFLDALGAFVRRARESADLSRWQLSRAAEISERHIAFIESGVRRTRASTLQRIALALAPDAGSTEALLAKFLELGGVAIAAESPYAERIARRRARRVARQRADAAWGMTDRETEGDL